jgi:hypothetical protein
MLLALGAACIAAVVRAPLRHATLVLLACTIVLPTTLPLPLGPRWLALSRLVLWAYTIGLAIRVRSGEVPARSLRPTRVHTAWLGFLAVGFVCGVILLKQPAPRFESVLIWLTFLDQALAFVAVLVAARVLGAWWVARAIGGLAAVLCAIAIGERHFGLNWNHFFFQGTPGSFSAGSAQLGARGDAVRIRGPSQFPLEFGWVCVLLFPTALVVASRSRSVVSRLVPAVLVLASVWTVSRSATLGFVLGTIVTLLLSRADRRLGALVLVGAIVAGLTYLAAPSLQEPFDAASADSAASRVRRWVAITSAVDERPLTGLGFAGPRAAGVRGTDTTYVLLYAMVGVIGITVFFVVIITALATLARGLRGPPTDERLLAAAAVATLVAALVGTAFYDLFTVSGSSRLFWMVAAIGVTISEATVVVSERPDRLRPIHVIGRASLPVIGAVAGAVLTLFVPARAATTAAFDVLSVEAAQAGGAEGSLIGRYLINTTCAVANTVEADGIDIECREPREASTIGELRVEGDAREDVDAAYATAITQIERHLPEVRVLSLSVARSKPTWARTAPVWFAVLGLAAALLFPRVAWVPRTVPVPPRTPAPVG